MRRCLAIIMIATPLAAAILIRPRWFPGFSHSSTAWAQTRRRPRTPSPKPKQAAQVDYSRFSHKTKKHLEEPCGACHKSPTKNWREARGFPDVADFPEHAACVNCHRQQFFRGARPSICAVCHSRVSPRDDARFHFRNPKTDRQFLIEFPHDKHQDLLALRPPSGESVVEVRLLRVSLALSRPAIADPQKRTYNNCEACHEPWKPVVPPPDGSKGGAFPAADTFKVHPNSHAYCFDCHWQAQKPTKDDCKGCHTLATVPLMAPVWPKRTSINFKHEGGGEKKQHLISSCTTCHINITRAASLTDLKPDVPIVACKECHSQETGSGTGTPLKCKELRGSHVISDELRCLKADKNFACTYCHDSNIGKLDPRVSHFLVAKEIQYKRDDLK